MSLEKIMKEYHENDLCIGDLLCSIPADGLSLNEAFELTIAAKKYADGDRFYRIIEGHRQEEL